MYMTGSTADALYTLDSTTGSASRIGTAAQFGVSETTPGGLAWHNGRLYMTGSGTNSLYTLDTDTGQATLVATGNQITGSSATARQLSGVASHNGELYVTTTTTGCLYRVDLDTLTGTRIGDDDFGDDDETHPNGIASHGSPATLYMIGGDTDKLYTIDTADGTATAVGTSTAFGVTETSRPGSPPTAAACT